MTSHYDRARVRDLLQRKAPLFDDFEALQTLRDIVDRNQNDGVFSAEEWTALRDWLSAENSMFLALHAVREAFTGRL